MKKILPCLLLLMSLVISCGPSQYALHLEMRHPSRSGLDLAGKSMAVVYLEGDKKLNSDFASYMSDGFAASLEKDYLIPEGSVPVYKMPYSQGADYTSKDTLINILMDVNEDVLFLFDIVRLSEMKVGAPVQFTMRMYCYDSMNKEDKVYVFGGSDNFQASADEIDNKAWEAGELIAQSFVSQWMQEQYSFLYYDSQVWYSAMDKVLQYDWKGAMDIWLTLIDTGDLMKRSCLEYNIATACYLMGDYGLAAQWLDLSDKDNKLPLSSGLRKRIEARD